MSVVVKNEQKQVAEFNNAWKGRGTLANLVKELERQKNSRVDFVSDLRHLMVVCGSDKNLSLTATTEQGREWLLDGSISFNKGAYSQLLEKCIPSIPKRFADALIEEKETLPLVKLINSLHEDKPGQKRLIRCLDGRVRAWLSPSYRIIDNYDMAFACMDVAQRQHAQVIEAGLSDTHMRIKFTTQQVWDKIDITQRNSPQGGWFAGAIGNRELQGKTILGAKVSGELPGGPGTVHPIITVSNSETGHGGFHVRIGILMGICFNVATLEDVISQIHLGGEKEEGIFTAETIRADHEVIMKKAQDAIRAAFDSEKFRSMVKKAREAQEHIITQPTAAVDNVIEVCGINEEHKEALLEYFLRDYDQTRFGLAQAVSRVAQDVDDCDEANEFEMLAGKIIRDHKLVAVPA